MSIRRTKSLINGVGINDATESITKSVFVNGKYKLVWRCPYYEKWKSMLDRCYFQKGVTRHKAYVDCYVCDEWLTFSNFKSWMETQDWEGKQLDKDLLLLGNKVYSPETCCFIYADLNVSIAKTKAGKYPTGVYYCYNVNRPPLKKPYYARLGNINSSNFKNLGMFFSPEEGHRAWQKAKIEDLNRHKSKYTNLTILRGITNRIDKLQFEYDNFLETIDYKL